MATAGRDRYCYAATIALCVGGFVADLALQLYPGFFAAYLLALATMSLTTSRTATLLSIALVIFLLWSGWLLSYFYFVDVQPVYFRVMATFVTILISLFVLYQQAIRFQLTANLEIMTKVQHLSGIGSFRVDLGFEIAQLSSKASDILGTDSNELGRDQLVEILSPSNAAVAAEIFNNKPYDFKLGIIRTDGTRRNIRIVGYPGQTEQDKTPCVLGWIDDLTEQSEREIGQKQRKDEVLERQRLEGISALAGQVAHDLNNMFTAIRGHAELLQNATHFGVNERESAHDIKDATDRAALLSQQLMYVSGPGSIVLEQLVVADVIREMSELNALVSNKGCELILDGVQQTNPVEIERAQLFQLILNLVVNAAEASEDHGGEVVLSTGQRSLTADALQQFAICAAEPGEFVYFKVADKGSGIDPAIQELIFEPAFSMKQAGHGLGLSAVRGIVTSHNGAVEMNSTADGSTFVIYLPSKPMSSKRTKWKPVTESNPQARGVLIVDDQESVTNLMARILSGFGFKPIPRNSGADALEFLGRESQAIGAALLDVSMPEMNGIECMRRIKRSWPEIPVLLMSGYWDAEMGGQIGADEVVAVLQKPFTNGELQEALSQAMSLDTETDRELS
ncbi:MAG: response regulator [Pseudomonadales bacterium]|nr:response regulator [Pseudomonadales bacterium]